MPIETTCAACGKPFSYSPSQASVYCSRDCYRKDWKKRTGGDNNWKRKQTAARLEKVQQFQIDSEIRAYFIGFLQADGSIDRKRVSIEINPQDQHILYLFEKEFGGSVSFRDRDTNFKKNGRI